MIHCGEIYLWSGGGGNIIGLHQLIIASGHKLGHGAALRGRTRVHFTKWNAHTVERGGLLDVRRPARQATGTNYDESILICRKGQYLKLVPSRHSGAAGEAGEQRGTRGERLVLDTGLSSHMSQWDMWEWGRGGD